MQCQVKARSDTLARNTTSKQKYPGISWCIEGWAHLPIRTSHVIIKISSFPGEGSVNSERPRMEITAAWALLLTEYSVDQIALNPAKY